MTEDDLIAAHRLRMRDHGSSKDHTEVSISYAISVLEEIQTWWNMGSQNYERLTNRITGLKSLITT